MNSILDSALKIEAYERLCDCVRHNCTFALTGAPRLARLVAAALISRERTVVYACETNADAIKACDDLSALIGEKAYVFPAREILLHELHAESEEARTRRIRAIHAAQSGEATHPHHFWLRLLRCRRIIFSLFRSVKRHRRK